MEGSHAVALAVKQSDVKVISAYPITPASDIMLYYLKHVKGKDGYRFLQAEDEIAAMISILGGAWTGVKTMTSTSGPGFSLMMETVGLAVVTETPCVVVNVQRGGPSTGNPTHVGQGDINQARWGTHGDHSVIALTASNHQDVFKITVEAFNMAETYRTPVILLLDEVIGHMREKLVIPEPGEIPVVERLRTSVKKGVDYHPYLPREDGRLPMSDFGAEHRYNVTGLFHDMWGFPNNSPKVVSELLRHLVDKIESNVNEISMYKEYWLDDAEFILISYGSSARSAIHMAKNRRSRGVKIGVLELQTIWPFPADMIREKCAGAKAVIVVEMNMGQVITQVKNAVDNPHNVFLANRIDGELISPSDIKTVLRMLQGKGV